MPETRTENADLAAAFHEFMARAAAERLAYDTGLLEGRLRCPPEPRAHPARVRLTGALG